MWTWCRLASRILHNSPLWTILGFCIDTPAPDILHGLDLGVLHRLFGTITWIFFIKRLLLSAEMAALLSDSDCNRASLEVLKGRIQADYRARQHDGSPADTTLFDLTLPMLGSPEYPDFDAKGGETRELLDFFTELVREHVGALGVIGWRTPSLGWEIGKATLPSKASPFNLHSLQSASSRPSSI